MIWFSLDRWEASAHKRTYQRRVRILGRWTPLVWVWRR